MAIKRFSLVLYISLCTIGMHAMDDGEKRSVSPAKKSEIKKTESEDPKLLAYPGANDLTRAVGDPSTLPTLISQYFQMGAKIQDSNIFNNSAPAPVIHLIQQYALFPVGGLIEEIHMAQQTTIETVLAKDIKSDKDKADLEIALPIAIALRLFTDNQQTKNTLTLIAFAILQHPINVNFVSSSGHTMPPPLHVAVLSDATDASNYIAARSPIENQGSAASTATATASADKPATTQSPQSLIQELLKKGANPLQKDLHGNTFHDYLKRLLAKPVITHHNPPIDYDGFGSCARTSAIYTLRASPSSMARRTPMPGFLCIPE